MKNDDDEKRTKNEKRKRTKKRDKKRNKKTDQKTVNSKWPKKRPRLYGLGRTLKTDEPAYTVLSHTHNQSPGPKTRKTQKVKKDQKVTKMTKKDQKTPKKRPKKQKNTLYGAKSTPKNTQKRWFCTSENDKKVQKTSKMTKTGFQKSPKIDKKSKKCQKVQKSPKKVKKRPKSSKKGQKIITGMPTSRMIPWQKCQKWKNVRYTGP